MREKALVLTFVVAVLLVSLSCIILARAERQRRADVISKSDLTVSIQEKDSLRSRNFACLPRDVGLDEVISSVGLSRRGVKVEDKLIEMKARCRNGKLVDGRRREIRFFRPSCWGNPPPDYREIQKRENEELARLKRHYAVVVFQCNPLAQ